MQTLFRHSIRFKNSGNIFSLSRKPELPVSRPFLRAMQILIVQQASLPRTSKLKGINFTFFLSLLLVSQAIISKFFLFFI